MIRKAVVAGLAGVLLAPGVGAENRIADIHEGTNISLALSPDGQVLVTDLLGRLWRLPSGGGGAEPLTPEDEAARFPAFDKSGRFVVYQRLVDGQWDLWLLELSTGKRRQLLGSKFDESEPDFSADGRSVVFVSNRTGHYCLWSVDVETGVLTQLTEEPGDASFPTVSPFGEIAYVRHEQERWSLRVLTPAGTSTEFASGAEKLTAPSWRPGGGVLIYNQSDGRSSELKLLVLGDEPVIKTLTNGEDVFAGRAAWKSAADYLYTADGRIWQRGIAEVSRHAVPLIAAVSVTAREPPLDDVALDAPGPNPVLGVAAHAASADGSTRVFVALGDLWLTRGTGAPRRLTDDAFVDADPSVAPDGSFAVFASDRGGGMELWRIALPGGSMTQLTHGSGKAYRPAVSPDGTRVAYLETRGFGPWSTAALRLMPLSAPASVRTLAAELPAPSPPHWGPAGHTLSVEVGRLGPARARRRLEVDAATGERSFAAGDARPDDAANSGLDGRSDVERRSALDAHSGVRARRDLGARSKLDAPPGNADGAGLDWTPAAPSEPYVVQVGRLFDGVRGDYVRDVDLHIEGQRLVAISPRDHLPLPAKVIDERDATVIPGLIDVHVHESSLMGERLGRIWLANGVTTVRELTDDVPAALERAESWASGRRLGPRLVVSFEPGGGVPGESGPAPATPLPSPIPVRRYSAMAMAYSLLRPGGPRAGLDPLGDAVPRPGRESVPGSDAEFVASPREREPAASLALADERADAGAAYRLRTSPLNLSYQDVLSTVVASQTVITSDLAAALGSAAPAKALQPLLDSPAFRRLYRDDERSRWVDRPAASASPGSLERNLARLIRAGARVAAGSEAPTVPYGLGVHMELALLADAGIPPDQVLRIATAQNALALGLDRQLGTLEAGKLADFVVLDGDPLQRLGDALKIVAVVKGGVWLDRERLLAGP